ncbi:MAG: hypothetical protein WA672_08390, partial [Candidatus Angelobacter sp.]
MAGTLASAERILALQKQYLDNQMSSDTGKNRNGGEADYNKFVAADLALQKEKVGATRDEVLSQEALVTLLRSQVNAEEEISKTKKITKGNAKTGAGREETNEASRRMKAQFDAERTEQEAEDRDRDEARNQAIALLQQNEKEKIDLTEKGSRERLAAIDAAIKEENNKGLQETSFYRSLLLQRVEYLREATTEQSRIEAEGKKEAAAHDLKMDELKIAAAHEHQALLNSMHRASAQELVNQEIQQADNELNVKMKAYERDLAALDKHDKDYQNKKKALEDKETELTQQHENQVTQIKEKAEQDRNAQILDAETRMKQLFARGFAEVITGHQTFAAMMKSIGDQVLTGMIENAIMSAAMDDFGKEKKAAKAAREAYTWDWEHGGPAAPI